MTVIVWDGKSLAADKLVLLNLIATPGIKIKRITQFNQLAGFSGAMSVGVQFFAWLEAGAKKEDYPAVMNNKDNGGIGMVITEDREILVYDHCNVPYVVDAPQHAIGAGAVAALVGLKLGHGAKEIVEAVNQFDICCGCGVDVLTHTPTKRKST